MKTKLNKTIGALIHQEQKKAYRLESKRRSIVDKFNSSIRFDLVRFETAKFGFKCAQTGCKFPHTWTSRLQAAVGIKSIYLDAQPYEKGAYINPCSVVYRHGIDHAEALLISAGFIKYVNGKPTVACKFDMNKNQ